MTTTFNPDHVRNLRRPEHEELLELPQTQDGPVILQPMIRLCRACDQVDLATPEEAMRRVPEACAKCSEVNLVDVQPAGSGWPGDEHVVTWAETQVRRLDRQPRREEVQALARSGASCCVLQANGAYFLGLYDGGTSVLWDWAEGFLVLGYLPPYLDLPRWPHAWTPVQSRIVEAMQHHNQLKMQDLQHNTEMLEDYRLKGEAPTHVPGTN